MAGSMRPGEAAIVVVNYRTRDHLARCLESVESHAPGAEVVVVDNASTDGSADMVAERFPDVHLIRNAENIGYGAAANQGVAACDAPFVVVLNADTELHANTVRRLVADLEAQPRAAIVGPKVVDAFGGHQPSTFPFPGTLGWLLENNPLAPVTRRVPLLRDRSVSFRNDPAARAVPWLLGAALAIRREPFEEVGGFDERFFMYFEEVDLCRRLERAGWQIRYEPAAQIQHAGGASTSQVRTAMLIQHFDSTVRYYRLHHSASSRHFWVGLMRIKRLALLLRDTAMLAAERGPARQKLLEQRRAWRALLGPTRLPGTSSIEEGKRADASADADVVRSVDDGTGRRGRGHGGDPSPGEPSA